MTPSAVVDSPNVTSKFPLSPLVRDHVDASE